MATQPDLVILCDEGSEVGCGEIKSHNKSQELVDTDKARVGEICKRQIHLQMLENKGREEHVSFGIVLAGKSE